MAVSINHVSHSDSGQLPDDCVWIQNPDELASLADRLSSTPWLAFDTESNSMYAYQERVCLIQLNIGGFHCVLDPFCFKLGRDSLGPLAEALENPDLPTYVHGGEYDCVVMNRDYGLNLRGIYDSQQAASLLGWNKTGYGAVVEEMCGVKLPKGHSDYNWGTRPLDDEALLYAVDDVRYLPEVIAKLQVAVAEADLEEEVAIANQAVEQVKARAPGFDPATLWRLKGISDVPNKKLGIAVALHRWRDNTAKELDKPPGRVLPNDVIVALARSAPSNLGSLRRMRMRSSILREYGEDILALVKDAQAKPPAIPEAPKRANPDPAIRSREQALKAWRRQEADRRKVAMQVVLPARALDQLKRSDHVDWNIVPQMGDKRIALYGETITKLVAKAGK